MSRSRALAGRLGITPLALTGLVTLTVVLGGSGLVASGLLKSVFSQHGKTVSAVFTDTAQLRKGAQVRESGIQVGRVKKITVNHGGRTATVEMGVFKEGFPLYMNATAAIRYKTALGGSLIVDLDRGTPAAGELSPRVIHAARTQSQVEVDEIISILRGQTRAGLRTLLAEVPRALSDRAAPAGALRTLADVSPGVSRGVGAVRGEREGDLRRLVARIASTMRALDSPIDVRDLVQGAATTLEATARRRADVRTTIGELARVQPRVVATLARLDGTLAVADPVIARLRGPAAQVAPTVARLRPTVAQADVLLRDARPLLHSLRPAAASLAAAARFGAPLLRELEPSLTRLDAQILPGLAERSPVTKRATYEMIGPALAGLGPAIAGHYDQRGHYVRFPASGSERSLGGHPCRTYFTDPEAPGSVPGVENGALIECEALDQALQTLFPSPGPR